tara:strand:- start:191 stop:1144 length:954 start_codon:yes stop_codon:yes gene_type:complete
MSKYLNIIIFITLVLISCEWARKVDPFDHDLDPTKPLEVVKEGINVATGAIGDSSEKIKADAERIKTETRKVDKTVSDAERPVVKPFLITIDEKADNIINNTKTLDEAKEKLKLTLINLGAAHTEISEIKSEYDRAVNEAENAIAERDEAIARENNATKAMIRWLIVASIAGFGVAIFLIFFGMRMMGIGLAAACISIVVVAVTVDKWFEYIAWGGLGVIVIIVGFVLYEFFIRDKAMKEVVHTTEMTKDRLHPDERRELFGHKSEPGLVYTVQSSATEKIVNKNRKKMKGSWERTIDKEGEEDGDKPKKKRRKRSR